MTEIDIESDELTLLREVSDRLLILVKRKRMAVSKIPDKPMFPGKRALKMRRANLIINQGERLWVNTPDILRVKDWIAGAACFLMPVGSERKEA